MTEILPGSIVEFSGDPKGVSRLIVEGVGVYIGPTTGVEWFHDGESLGDTGSAISTSLIRRIGHDDDVNYARTLAATRSGRGSGFRSEALAESGGVTTPESTPEAVSEAPRDSRGGSSHARPQVVYISGPMTGYPEYNFPAFNAAAYDLMFAGYEVLNPADKGVIDGWDWTDYLRYDLGEIAKADAIYTLPGWRESKGARLEMHVADELGIEWINPDVPKDETEESLATLAEECESESVQRFAGRFFAGEVRKVSETGGEKGSKPERYDLIPWDAMDAVARVYGFGAIKYDDHNWRKCYPWGLSIASAFRHLIAFTMGEDRDPESGELHPAHAVFHLLALIAWTQTGRHSEYDTRYKVGEIE